MDFWQFSPYLIIYFAAAAISFLLSFIAWNLKPGRGKRVLSIALLANGVWITTYAISISSTSLQFKLLLLRIEYAGLITAIYLWFIFVIYYTQYNHLLKKWVFIVLAIIPVFAYIQVLTLTSHSFFYYSYQLKLIKGLYQLTKVYGTGFYIWTGYAYFVLIASLFVVFFKMISSPRKYRKQIIPVAVAVSILIVPNIFYITGCNPLYPYDLTGIFFAIIGCVMLYSVHFYNFLDILPVAHNLVVKSAKTGIVILDESDRILEINPVAEKAFQCKQGKYIGRSVVTILPEYNTLLEDDPKHKESIKEIKLGRLNLTYEIKITSLELGDKEPAGRIILLWDITELKNTLNELDAFAHTVAHDLKNPVAQISSFANFLGDVSISDEERKKYVQYISDGSDKMSNIIEQLLILAKIRNIKTYENTPLDMGQIVEHAITRVYHKTAEQNVRIIKPEKWPALSGNALWVEEIWVNLISNAYKYGGSTPVIELGFIPQDTAIRFWVKDNGEGITKEEQIQLFSKFSRLSRHKKGITGHGLGLSIVQRIVEKLGGNVGVESKKGEGSTFCFSLPKN